MNDDTTFLELIGALLIAFVFDLLCAIWISNIILQTIVWYEIGIKTNLQTVFGWLMILSLATISTKPDERKWYERMFMKFFIILIGWATIYLFHFFI